MLDLSLLSPSTTSTSSKITSAYLPSSLVPSNSTTTIAHSRRPAILTQISSPLQHFTTLLSLPWYIIGLRSLRNLESEKLVVPMFERVEFPRGRGNVPAFARVELIPSSPASTGSIGGKVTEAACASRSTMQIYSLTLSIRARFSGLRWVMYNHRIISFSVFSTAFYTISLLTMSIAWVVLSFFFGSFSSAPPSRKDKAIKEEQQQKANGAAIKAESEEPTPAVKSEYIEDDDEGDLPSLSDSIASPFPTLGRQMPLRMPLPTTSGSPTATGTASARGSRGGTISEPATAATASTSAAALLEGLGPEPEREDEEGHLAEADDEGDEDEEGERDAGGLEGRVGLDEGEGEESVFRDSGIGTSVNESVRERRRQSEGLHRRRSTRDLRDH